VRFEELELQHLSVLTLVVNNRLYSNAKIVLFLYFTRFVS